MSIVPKPKSNPKCIIPRHDAHGNKLQPMLLAEATNLFVKVLHFVSGNREGYHQYVNRECLKSDPQGFAQFLQVP